MIESVDDLLNRAVNRSIGVIFTNVKIAFVNDSYFVALTPKGKLYTNLMIDGRCISRCHLRQFTSCVIDLQLADETLRDKVRHYEREQKQASKAYELLSYKIDMEEFGCKFTKQQINQLIKISGGRKR